MRGRQALVADAGGNEDGVARLDRDRLAGFPAETDLGLAGGNSKHFVGGRMIVMEREDSVPPAPTPTVALEQRLEGRRRVAVTRVDRAGIEDQRKSAVRYVAVIAEGERTGLHRASPAAVFPARAV